MPAGLREFDHHAACWAGAASGLCVSRRCPTPAGALEILAGMGKPGLVVTVTPAGDITPTARVRTDGRVVWLRRAPEASSG